MLKKLIAFDLDGTLTPSKSPLSARMATQLNNLLDKFEVCIISGGMFSQYQQQLFSSQYLDSYKFYKLYILPTCGTECYRFKNDKWDQIYSEEIDPKSRKKISDALLEALDHFGYRPNKIYGAMVEDRKSQVTLSVLGQDIVMMLGDEGVKLKEVWDPDNSKKTKN